MRRSMLYRLPHTGTETVLRKTALHEVHIQHKAKMVNFGGWSMPVQYSKGIVAEHKHTRNTCSVFDVSHMGQVTVVGPGAARFLEWLTPLALENLKPTSTKLSILMNENGGILDDIMVTKDTSDSFYMVVNATRFENDLKHMLMQREKWLENKCQKSTFEIIPHYDSLSLLAIQGPAAVHVLRKEMEPGIEKVPFMESRAQVQCFSNKVRITRCGYTGEDGFEISVANNQVEEFLNALLNNKRCAMAGLGARDTLRLEAGLCLYGHELTETISPREAGLMWTIPKVRKETGGFIGFEALKKILASPLIKKRIGLAIKSGPPARQGATVCQGDATAPIGVVTSGSPSPTLGHNIAQAYIDPKSATSEHGQIKVVVREKLYDAQIVSLPFVPHNYFRGSV